MASVGIVIPTMNRPDFLARQLTYYADVGCTNTVYVGDSSDASCLERTSQVINQIRDRVTVVHIPLPGLNASEVVSRLMDLITEPYVAYIGDDDFLVPRSLEKCARFLDANADFSTAHGVSALCILESPGAHGRVGVAARYWQRSAEASSARERLTHYLNNYYGSYFSVQNKQVFQKHVNLGLPMTDRALLGELLPNCLSIVRGKAKQLDCLYMVRQAHSQIRVLPDSFDWITSADWPPAYETFCDVLADELTKQDELRIDEAREVVKRAFWSYLAQRIAQGWAEKYRPKESRPIGRMRSKVARRLPLLRKTWHQLRSRVPGKSNRMRLGALLRPSSPYHADFMPIYRAMTVLPPG